MPVNCQSLLTLERVNSSRGWRRGGALTVDVTDRCSETQQVCGFIIITFIQTASCSGQEHQQENPGVLRDVLLLLLPELLLSWSCFRLPRAGWTS